MDILTQLFNSCAAPTAVIQSSLQWHAINWTHIITPRPIPRLYSESIEARAKRSTKQPGINGFNHEVGF